MALTAEISTANYDQPGNELDKLYGPLPLLPPLKVPVYDQLLRELHGETQGDANTPRDDYFDTTRLLAKLPPLEDQTYPNPWQADPWPKDLGTSAPLQPKALAPEPVTSTAVWIPPEDMPTAQPPVTMRDWFEPIRGFDQSPPSTPEVSLATIELRRKVLVAKTRAHIINVGRFPVGSIPEKPEVDVPTTDRGPYVPMLRGESDARFPDRQKADELLETIRVHHEEGERFAEQQPTRRFKAVIVKAAGKLAGKRIIGWPRRKSSAPDHSEAESSD